MKLSLLGVLFILCAQSLIAQTNIYPGKLFLEDGTTINAFIKFSAYEGTPQDFSYTTAENSETKRINKDQLKKIELQDGTVYEKYTINVYDINKNYLDRLLWDYSEPNLIAGKYLLEKVVSGKIELYQFLGKYPYPHFFYNEPNDTGVVYLRNNTFVDDNRVLQEDKAYSTSLKSLVANKNCVASLTRKVENLKYEKTAIIRTFQNINECAGGQAVALNKLKNNKPIWNTGVVGGVAAASVGNVRFPRSMQTAFGIYTEILPAKKVQNYKLGAELIYKTFSTASDSLISDFERGQQTIDVGAVHLNTVFTYLLKPSSRTVFVEGGLNLMYLTQYESVYKFKNVYNNVQSTSYTLSSKFYPGLLAGVGYQFGRLSIRARYDAVLKQLGQGFNSFGVVAKVKLK